jgi:hypothetical protein
MAVALFPRHARDHAALASGAPETQVETLASPASCRAPKPRSLP